VVKRYGKEGKEEWIKNILNTATPGPSLALDAAVEVVSAQSGSDQLLC
jgi:hypothetical protein